MTITRIIRTPALLLGVIALLLTGLTLPAQAASTTGAVKGVVTVDGKPLKGVTIELYWYGADGYSGPRLDVDTTNSKGAYSFSGFPIDHPWDEDLQLKSIVIKDPSRRIVDTSRYFDDRAGRTVTRNASVKKAATITGTVKRGDGAATARLRTDVFGPYVLIDRFREVEDDIVYDTDVRVATDGSFKLEGLPAGDYYLQFVDEGKTYYTQCYDNLPAATTNCNGTNGSDKPDATKITVATGQDVTLNAQTLTTKGRRISGTVTDTSGRPIGGADVTAVASGEQKGLKAETTVKSGSFTVGPLADGTYRVSVDSRSPWASQSVDTDYDLNGQDVSGVQVKLKSRATIKATLTPGTGTVKVAVDVTRTATGSKPSGKTTIRWGTVSKTVDLVDGRGTVKLSGLPEGKRQITVSYAGTSSTAATTKLFYATVK